MPAEEADQHISRIEHSENIPICHAVVGRINETELNDDAKEVYQEFKAWSDNRTRRIRDEQWSDRRRNKESRIAQKLTKLHEQGRVSDEALLMYGISGDLPQRNVWREMSEEEKQHVFQERVERRFGPNWRDFFGEPAARPILGWISAKVTSRQITNWQKEGF